MNRKILIIVALLLFLGVGGWYFLSDKKTADNTSTTIGMNNDSKNESSTSSLKDLITKGGSQTCTYTTESGSGKVYVAGGKVRGDFETKTEDLTLKSHMIVKDNTSYIWTDGQNTGFKMTFDTASEPAPTIDKGDSSTANSGFDMGTDYNYSCNSWNTDASMFDLPEEISFNEFNLPTSGMQPASGSQGGSASQCSYCDALTGTDKAQCLTALKCN